MQTVSFAGSTYNIPKTRGDRPWSGMSDFVIAAASKCINTAGGNFTLLADINFGASFGLVSAYFTSRTSTAATAGAVRLAKTDVVSWRNNANGANIDLSKDTSDNLKWNSTKILLSGAVVNADIQAAAAIALNKLAALTASRAVVSDGSGFMVSATTTATEIGYVNGVTSAIQTQIDTKAAGSIASGGANRVAYYTGATALAAATAITASRALVSDSNGLPVHSAVTTTELGYVSGVTSAIQTQLGTKVATSGDETITGVKTFSGQLIGKGTATTDSAAAGYIGEVISATASAIGMTTGTYKNVTSITLTAGDWDVSGMVGFVGAAGTSVTDISGGFSLTTNTRPALGTFCIPNSSGEVFVEQTCAAVVPATVGVGLSVSIPATRISLSGSVTYYLVGQATFTVSTLTTQGIIRGRRVR